MNINVNRRNKAKMKFTCGIVLALYALERFKRLFVASTFQDHSILKFVKKMGPEKKFWLIESPDNRGPDN